MFYWGPGDVRCVALGANVIGSMLSTINITVSTDPKRTEGIGERWGRNTPLGVRRVEASQAGWFAQEIREVLHENRQTRSEQLAIIPMGEPGQPGLIVSSETKSEIAVKTAKDDLVMADVTHATSGELVDDALYCGFLEKFTPTLLLGDPTPVANSLTQLQLANIGSAQTTSGGRIYVIAGVVSPAPYYELRVKLQEAGSSPTFQEAFDFTGPDAINRLVAGTIPRELRLDVGWTVKSQWKLTSNALVGDDTIAVSRVISGSERFKVGTEFTIAGHGTVYTVLAFGPSSFDIEFAPDLTHDVTANQAVDPVDADSRAADVFVMLRRN